MKNNFLNIAVVASLLITTASCNKQLDQLPTGSVSTGQYWKTANDALLARNGFYGVVPSIAYDYWYFDGASDNSYAQYPWESNATNIAAGNINSATVDGIAGDYSNYYNYIRRFNTFLDNIGTVNMDATLKSNYIGEAMFLRAFSYFLLTEMYGDVPLAKSSKDEEISLEPTKEADIISFVLQQLDSASTILPETSTGVSFASKDAAIALKARIEISYGQWANAAKDALSVINKNKYSLFRLSSLSATDVMDNYSRFVTFNNAADSVSFYLGLRSYQGQYYKSNEGANKELLFVCQYVANTKYQYNQQYTNGLNALMLPSAIGGWSSINPTKSMLDAYGNRDGSVFTPVDNAQLAQLYNYPNTPNPSYFNSFKNRDPRLYASIFFTGNQWNAFQSGYSFTWGKGGNNNSQTGYNFRKLVDPAFSSFPEFTAGQSFPLIRYAEVLLTYAEAQNEVSGPDQTIYNALNLVRGRSGMPNVDQSKYNSQTTLRDFIRNERRVELAMEGFRYIDIRRWNIAAQVMGSVYDATNGLAQQRTWNAIYKKLPYPQGALDRNSKLAPAQAAKGY